MNISKEDYELVLYKGFLIPPNWSDSDAPEPIQFGHLKNPVSILCPQQLENSHKNPQLSSKSREILRENQRPANWCMVKASQIAVSYAGTIIKNNGSTENLELNIIEAIHSAQKDEKITTDIVENNHIGNREDDILSQKYFGQKESTEPIQNFYENLTRVLRLVDEARRVSKESGIGYDVISSKIYDIGSDGNLFREMTPYAMYVTCGTSVAILSLHERNSLWRALDSNSSLENFSRVALWELNPEDWPISLSRFKTTPKFSKNSGLKKVDFDSKLTSHLELGGCYEYAVVLMGGWITRNAMTGNHEYLNLVCNSALSFYIDHSLDTLGHIDMYELLCKLGGLLELGIGVEHVGLGLAGTLHNHVKRTLEETTGGSRISNIRHRFTNRFEFLGFMICDIGGIELTIHDKPLGKTPVNDLAICGFLQDFTDPGEDSAVGELGLSIGAWGSVLDTRTVRTWIKDLARLQNDGIIHRPESPIVGVNYLITMWNIAGGRHHTLARALSYLRHSHLGFIDGCTQLYDLFDEDMNYMGHYNPAGSLLEVDGKKILQECAQDWVHYKELTYFGKISSNLVSTVEAMRASPRALNAALLLIRWMIYVPRLIRQDITNENLSHEMAKLCYKIENQLTEALLIITCWEKFDDPKFGFLRCREMCAEAAALYSLDNRMSSIKSIEEFYTDLSFLGKNDSRF